MIPDDYDPKDAVIAALLRALADTKIERDELLTTVVEMARARDAWEDLALVAVRKFLQQRAIAGRYKALLKWIQRTRHDWK